MSESVKQFEASALLQKTIASPCVSICALDEDDICRGCYRSLSEITGWMAMNDEQRLQVLERAKQREQA